MNADMALQKLIGGNVRFVTERYAQAGVGPERRRELTAGQRPFAAVLGCADSRVPPEIIFDQGLGELFVVRIAGQAIDKVVLGSLEYAVEHLGVELIVVLGHEDCGAVKAAAASVPPPGQLAAVTAAVYPAVRTAAAAGGELVADAIVANVCHGAERLACSPVLQAALQTGRLKIVGAVYSLAGRVVFLSLLPRGAAAVPAC